MQEQSNNLALASMICGILSIVLSCCCCVGVVPGSLAILFACLSRVEESFNKRAKIGLITGIVGLLMAAAVIVLLLVLAALGEFGFRSNIYF